MIALSKLKNDTLNVSTGKETSVNKLINIFSKLLNKKIKIEYINRTKGQIKNTYVDKLKFKKNGFEPKVDLIHRIKKLIKLVKNKKNY